MRLNEPLLAEFESEMSITRRMLERVPMDRPDWRPHQKSTPLGQLASHLANIPGWAAVTILQDSLDLAPPGQAPFQTPQASSAEELLTLFDRSVAEGRKAIAGAGDEQLLQTWTLLHGGRAVFSAPRLGVLRGMVLYHSTHHRAQLGLYLRLNDIPLPSTYGPSADEGAM